MCWIGRQIPNCSIQMQQCCLCFWRCIVAYIVFYINIFLASMYVKMNCTSLIQSKRKNFGCHKSSCCSTVWNPKNITMHSTNWIFRFGILKYHDRCDDSCTLSSCYLHYYSHSNLNWDHINIFNIFVTFKSMNLSIITIDNEMGLIYILMRSLCNFPDSKWHFKGSKWDARGRSMYPYLEAETISFSL